MKHTLLRSDGSVDDSEAEEYSLQLRILSIAEDILYSELNRE
jgi:hypothetical protein